MRLFRYIELRAFYRPKGFVNILGKVYLDNPNIQFGRNVTVFPNVHIFGLGKVTLGDNVSIGDGTIICAAQDIVIGKNTMIAAQCYIIDCNHGMHLCGGGCVNNHYRYIQQKLERMYGLVVGARFWQELKYLMVQ